jgi:hypothetical protein
MEEEVVIKAICFVLSPTPNARIFGGPSHPFPSIFLLPLLFLNTFYSLKDQKLTPRYVYPIVLVLLTRSFMIDFI